MITLSVMFGLFSILIIGRVLVYRDKRHQDDLDAFWADQQAQFDSREASIPQKSLPAPTAFTARNPWDTESLFREHWADSDGWSDDKDFATYWVGLCIGPPKDERYMRETYLIWRNKYASPRD